jgi:hypothetical protein
VHKSGQNISYRCVGACAEAGDQCPVDSAYVQMFLLKYVCPGEECCGTLAPLPATRGALFECNVCGSRRSEAEFLAELEQLHREQSEQGLEE